MTSQTTFTSCMHDQMLESNRDDVKLEAMRCVTVMTAKGKLSVPRTLFPHIVKNVSSKNPELKKLIYLYLTSFADQEPDLALLPVASLQKSLKSPNPLVRSSALKVLTSMRLNILSAILMATLRNSVNDLSPYVRKTVAHSIIKIYRLDKNLRPDLIEYIERLFNDKNSMVLSSAVAAYEVVCPERLDLVQKHYRRFCFILADCNEWGQTLMLKLLVRLILKTCKKTASGISSSADHDPKILLRSAKPLVHSNNSAVVMAVTKLFIAIANHNEVRSTITRPLIRLLYSHREIQLVVLAMIEDLITGTSTLGGMNPYEDDKDEIKEIFVNPPSTNGSDNIKVNDACSPKTSDNSKDGAGDFDGEKFVVEEPVITSRDGYIALDDNNTAADPDGLCNETNDTAVDINSSEAKPMADQKSRDSEICETEKGEDDQGENDEEGDDDDDDDDDDEDEDDEDEEDEDSEDSEESDESDEEEEEESSDDERMIEKVSNNCRAIKRNKDIEPEKEDDVSQNKDSESSYIDLSGNKDPRAYKEIFRPYIKSFYVRHNDCTQIRLAKLRILTNLSSSVNVSQILRELQAYISIYVDDVEFVSAAIHAIGRCAILVKEVAHTCLNGLTTLLSNNNEHVVSEAIVVLRSQIINKKTSRKLINDTSEDCDKSKPDGDVELNEDQDSNHEDGENDDKMVSAVIKQVTKLLPKVVAPQARATILWILAEFCDKNLTAAKAAPNVLRLVAKSFCQENNFVKLQTLTLASKFLISLDIDKKPELYNKIRLIAGYLFNLAKYDTNHDVRDRGRFLKKLLEDEKLCARVINGEAQEGKVS